MLIYFCIRELKTTKSKMDSQTKQVSEYASRMDDYDKKFEENSRKFGTLLAVSVFPHEPRARNNEGSPQFPTYFIFYFVKKWIK